MSDCHFKIIQCKINELLLPYLYIFNIRYTRKENHYITWSSCGVKLKIITFFCHLSESWIWRLKINKWMNKQIHTQHKIKTSYLMQFIFLFFPLKYDVSFLFSFTLSMKEESPVCSTKVWTNFSKARWWWTTKRREPILTCWVHRPPLCYGVLVSHALALCIRTQYTLEPTLLNTDTYKAITHPSQYYRGSISVTQMSFIHSALLKLIWYKFMAMGVSYDPRTNTLCLLSSLLHPPH